MVSLGYIAKSCFTEGKKERREKDGRINQSPFEGRPMAEKGRHGPIRLGGAG